MQDVNLIAVLVTVVTSAGFGAVVKSIVDGVVMSRQGVSGREDKRRTDIIAQRDHAIAQMREAERGEAEERSRADAAERARDKERDNRRRAQEHLATARMRLLERGENPGPWPDFDDTETTHKT